MRPLHKLNLSAFFLICLLPSLSWSRVLVGADQIDEKETLSLRGRKIAVLTNHTGVDGSGRGIVDILRDSREFELVAVLTPEHGFTGTVGHGETVEDSTDSASGLKIFSLYGKSSRPTDVMLRGVDTIVFDIQDIGTRFYTYIGTMGQTLEEAAKRKIRFIVLDRPNPIRGDIFEGDILDSDIKRLTGFFPIPVRHGLTVGEIALWMNKVQKLGADVRVIKLKDWKRSQWFDQTGLPFIAPSPNISSLTAAILYPGIGSFEASNMAVGRGTDTPFEIFGAPWIDGKALCAHLRSQNLPGFLAEPVEFTPTKDIYMDKKCRGVRITVTDRNKIRPLDIFVHSFLFLEKTYPQDFKPDWEEIRVVTGSSKLRDCAEGRLTVEELIRHYENAAENFKKSVEPFLLY